MKQSERERRGGGVRGLFVGTSLSPYSERGVPIGNNSMTWVAAWAGNTGRNL